MKRIKSVHPPLLAIYFPLALYSVNAGIVPWTDVVVPTLAILVSVILLWLAAFRLLKDQTRSAAVASACLVCFFCHTAAMGLASSVAEHNLSGFANLLRVGVWIVVAFAIIVGSGWKGKHNTYSNQFLNFASCVIVALATYSVATTGFKRSAFLESLNHKSANQASTVPAVRPDVFYIVLDGYGSNDTFNSLYNYDNSGFYADLQSRGFFIAERAYSNFCETEISLASSLNYAGPDALPKAQGDPALDRILLDKIIDESKVSQKFQEYGYKYLAVTTGFPPFTFDSADYVLHDKAKFSLFLDALLAKTPIRYATDDNVSRNDIRRKQLLTGFESLKQLAKGGSDPRFIVAHILAPHPPFVFGPIGEPVQQKRIPFGLWDGNHYLDVGGTKEGYRSGYIEQLQYVNRLVLESVDTIRLASPNAIIILQGDHGPKSETNQNELAKTNIDELFGILYAVRAPDRIQKRLYSTITPINTFRIVLSELFGVNLKLAEDKSYFSGWESPLVFVDVTESHK